MIRGFGEIKKHFRKFLLLVEIMLEGAPMPCFLGGSTIIDGLKTRFALKMNQTVKILLYWVNSQLFF